MSIVTGKQFERMSFNDSKKTTVERSEDFTAKNLTEAGEKAVKWRNKKVVENSTTGKPAVLGQSFALSETDPSKIDVTCSIKTVKPKKSKS